MKQRFLSTLAICGISLAALTSAATVQAASFEETRRTLHVSVNQKNMVLEAPKDLCFLTGNNTLEEAYRQAHTDMFGKNLPMLGVFAPCMTVAGLGKVKTIPDPLATGQVLHLADLEAQKDLQSYLDYAVVALPDHIEQKKNEKLKEIEKMPLRGYSPKEIEKQEYLFSSTTTVDTLRSDHAVIVVRESAPNLDMGDDRHSLLFLATTQLKGNPVLVRYQISSKEKPQMATYIALIEEMMESQVALNTQKDK